MFKKIIQKKINLYNVYIIWELIFGVVYLIMSFNIIVV